MLSQDEKELVTQLRSRVTDLTLTEDQQHEEYLVMWIRARDHDAYKAEEMLRNSIKWRRDNDIDNLSSWCIPDNIIRDFPFVISGVDLEGCPVGILPLGIWDVKKAVDSGLRDTYVKYVDHIVVYQFGQAFKNLCRRGVNQLVLVMDMKEYLLSQVTSMSTLETIMETVKRFDLNHPETLKSAIVINAPKYFSIAFEIVKRVMSAKTISKVQVFGNPAKWQPVLFKTIPPESIPIGLGGLNYEAQQVLAESKSLIEEKSETRATLHVGPGSKLHLHKEVHDRGSIINWSFRVHEHDIGFAIFHENGNEIQSYKKYSSVDVDISKGLFRCKEIGKYTLVFDNSYSRVRGKKLHYNLHIQRPEL